MSTVSSALYDEIEEDQDRELRMALGLRAIAYDVDSDGQKQSHPDQRPCPPWCWVAQHSEYDHSVDWGHPMSADHRYEPRGSIVASLYPGRYNYNEERTPSTTVDVATIETYLMQRGQDEPVIEVLLRQYPDGKKQTYCKVLKLTATDARELAKVLTHFANIADLGDAPTPERQEANR